jgi:hypothetical protein
VSVGGPDGPVAAVSVPLPAQRFEASERAIVAGIRRAQAAINALFGSG